MVCCYQDLLVGFTQETVDAEDFCWGYVYRVGLPCHYVFVLCVLSWKLSWFCCWLDFKSIAGFVRQSLEDEVDGDVLLESSSSLLTHFFKVRVVFGWNRLNIDLLLLDSWRLTDVDDHSLLTLPGFEFLAGLQDFLVDCSDLELSWVHSDWDLSFFKIGIAGQSSLVLLLKEISKEFVFEQRDDCPRIHQVYRTECGWQGLSSNKVVTIYTILLVLRVEAQGVTLLTLDSKVLVVELVDCPGFFVGNLWRLIQVQLDLPEFRQRYNLEGFIDVVFKGEETGLSFLKFQHILLTPLQTVDRWVKLQHRDGIVTYFGCLYGNEVFGRSTVVRENEFVGLKDCSQFVFGTRVLG